MWFHCRQCARSAIARDPREFFGRLITQAHMHYDCFCCCHRAMNIPQCVQAFRVAQRRSKRLYRLWRQFRSLQVETTQDSVVGHALRQHCSAKLAKRAVSQTVACTTEVRLVFRILIPRMLLDVRECSKHLIAFECFADKDQVARAEIALLRVSLGSLCSGWWRLWREDQACSGYVSEACCYLQSAPHAWQQSSLVRHTPVAGASLVSVSSVCHVGQEYAAWSPSLQCPRVTACCLTNCATRRSQRVSLSGDHNTLPQRTQWMSAFAIAPFLAPETSSPQRSLCF